MALFSLPQPTLYVIINDKLYDTYRYKLHSSSLIDKIDHSELINNIFFENDFYDKYNCKISGVATLYIDLLNKDEEIYLLEIKNYVV